MRTLSRKAPSFLLRHSPLAAALATALIPAMAATYTVTNNADSGTGSLRAAMQAAVSACDTAAVIEFSGPFTISPSTPLPSISTNCPPPAGQTKVTLNGASAPGWSANTQSVGFNANNVVVVDGASFSSYGCGFQTSNFGYGAGVLAVRGMQFRNFTYGGFATALCGNLDVKGSEIYGNNYALDIDAGSVVGGPGLADRNVIRANTNGAIDGQGAVNITNNYIGVDNPGTGGSPNGGNISLFNASGSIIANNVIANGYYGVSLNNSSGVTISGNTIGMDATKSIAMGNDWGIDVQCAPGLQILNNLISANAYGGVYLALSDNTQISGNKIGVAGDGSTAMGNGGPGVEVAYGGFCGGSDMAIALKGPVPGGSNALQVTGNTIAHNTKGFWLAAGAGATFSTNTIKANSIHGIAITTGNANKITNNSIWGNGGKNIDLDYMYGGLPNDTDPPPDKDGGPNDRQNHPVVLGVTQSVVSNQTFVTWELRSTPSLSHEVEFYSNATAGVPGGLAYRGPATAPTDANGLFTTTTALAGLHDHISMLAWGPGASGVDGGTSEFSPAVSLTPTPEVVMTPASPATVSFGTIPVGSTSAPQSISLASVGSAPYVITGLGPDAACYGGPICSSGAFACSVGCNTGTPYASGSSCSISVTFSPLVAAPATETFHICDNAAGSPRIVTLTGTGAPPPVLGVNPLHHDFGQVMIGAAADKTFTVNNSGTTAATLSPPTATPPFSIAASTCSSSLAPATSCNVTVRYSPTSVGPASGTLTVASSFGNSTSTLVGSGLSLPALSMAGDAIDFGGLTLNSPEVGRPVNLRNSGNAPLAIQTLSVSTPFTLTNACPPTLQPGEGCTVTVNFNPAQLGTFTGNLNVVTDAPGGSRAIPVRALVQPRPEPIIRVTPSSIGFGARLAGTASPTQQVTILNEGGASANLALTLTMPHFSIVNTSCGPTLAPQQTCFAELAFVPQGFGPRRSQLVVTSNAPNSPAAVSLSGAGCRPDTGAQNRGGGVINCRP